MSIWTIRSGKSILDVSDMDNAADSKIRIVSVRIKHKTSISSMSYL